MEVSRDGLQLLFLEDTERLFTVGQPAMWRANSLGGSQRYQFIASWPERCADGLKERLRGEVCLRVQAQRLGVGRHIAQRTPVVLVDFSGQACGLGLGCHSQNCHGSSSDWAG